VHEKQFSKEDFFFKLEQRDFLVVAAVIVALEQMQQRNRTGSQELEFRVEADPGNPMYTYVPSVKVMPDE
jgi:hypothetical protein